MDLKEIMELKNFVVVGNTLNEEHYAYKIKHALLSKGYNVQCVYKELKSIDDVIFDIDCLDLCINPVKGLEILKESKKTYKVVCLQPGSESDELISYLEKENIPYIKGCLLVGLSLYKNN